MIRVRSITLDLLVRGETSAGTWTFSDALVSFDAFGVHVYTNEPESPPNVRRGRHFLARDIVSVSTTDAVAERTMAEVFHGQAWTR